MKKLFFAFIIIAVSIGVSVFFVHDQGGAHRTSQLVRPNAVTEVLTATPVTKALPVTLEIPKLGISAPIEYVGMDSKGNMDVPKKNADVAWFQPGYLPGTNGNAVIAGHLDTVTGAPAVFYYLSNLSEGDTIRILQNNGKRLTFMVTAKHIYPADSFPLQTVFGPADSPQLNLITCQGTWSAAKHAYSNRTVISSILKE